MIRFLHTADWQIGMKARHVAGVAARVREARLETARRLMELVRGREVDFVIIAGDVFEDNQVDNKTAHEVVRILSLAAPMQVYLLPGNHDPLTPDSIYERRIFQEDLPPNIHILRTTQPITVMPGVILLPVPNQAKNSTDDPTELMAKVPEEAIKIGIAHGSLRIEGRYQPNDFPIAMDAAGRLGLDYLALGHWHSFFQYGDRVFYPGTPEPTGFEERDSGTAILVNLNQHGEPPQVEKLKTSTLNWVSWQQEIQTDLPAVIKSIKNRVEAISNPEQTLLHLSLNGRDISEDKLWLAELRDWLETRLMYLDLDTTHLITHPITPVLKNRARSQPFLQATIADLAEVARILGQPLQDLDDVVKPVENFEDGLFDGIIKEGFKPEDVQESLRVLATAVEEV